MENGWIWEANVKGNTAERLQGHQKNMKGGNRRERRVWWMKAINWKMDNRKKTRRTETGTGGRRYRVKLKKEIKRGRKENKWGIRSEGIKKGRNNKIET